MSDRRRTPLYATHVRLGGRMVEFAGFDMPVQYTSIVDEHRAVRESAGLFDVSHMGQIHLSGPGAIDAAERLVTCPVASLRPGRVRYGLLCNTEGGVVDDVTVYRSDEHSLFLCVNASNIEKDDAWIREHTAKGVPVENRSDATGLLALQGPQSATLLASLAGGCDPQALRRFTFAEGTVAGAPALISRTGYTGSDGYELYLAAEDTERVFEALLDSGATPAGLGARDTLRLEAALPLYGHELDDQSSPLEAGLERFVKREAGGFIGAEAIEKRAREGHARALVGFEMTGRGIARADYPVLAGTEAVGRVTSGAPSPTLGKAIGLAWVPTRLAAPGTAIDIGIRGKSIAARVVETPFVTKVTQAGAPTRSAG